VRPGRLLGTLSISGDYTQTSTRELDIEKGGSAVCTASDLLAISGVACVAASGQTFSTRNEPDGSKPTECDHPTSLRADRGKPRTAISCVSQRAKLDGSALHKAVNR
jgi:hypothetical protein